MPTQDSLPLLIGCLAAAAVCAWLWKMGGQVIWLGLASVAVVVAGMEGALASVVGGLVDYPVIAVPTSVGYGASFHGLAALLAMLNSCASGVTVVNIDNGFGAGYTASLINRRCGAAVGPTRESVNQSEGGHTGGQATSGTRERVD